MTPLYEDEDLVVFSKPSGLHVHPTALSLGEDSLLLQAQRDLGYSNLFPVHRIDRATSGLVMFSKSSEMAAALNHLLATGKAHKRYLALVRGWCTEPWVGEGSVRDPWTDKRKEAVTEFFPRKQWELSVPLGRYATCRFSLVEARPLTGRTHQIRQHLKQVSHPIIGDTRYGNGDQNRFFRDHFGWERLFLHAFALNLLHPRTGLSLNLSDPIDETSSKLLSKLQQESAPPQ